MTSEYKASSLVDRARQLARMVVRNARDKNKWRKVVKVRLWMPIALQLALIGIVLWYTSTRSEGFINAANVTNVLVVAIPLAIAAIAQTHALLVGYLDLSVGAMISLGVVIASYLIVPGSVW
jgi:ribose/xylose/arabinose/galactoside ABC-type transport system permease subunit